jgi:DNA-binding transcriptional regulator YiaG
LAHLTFTQRSIHAVYPIKADIPKLSKLVRDTPQTLGELLVACRKKAGLKQRELAAVSRIPRKWLGRWERNRAVPTHEELNRLSQILELPALGKMIPDSRVAGVVG